MHEFGAICCRKLAKTSLKVDSRRRNKPFKPDSMFSEAHHMFFERKLAFRTSGGIFSPCKSNGPQAHRPSQVPYLKFAGGHRAECWGMQAGVPGGWKKFYGRTRARLPVWPQLISALHTTCGVRKKGVPYKFSSILSFITTCHEQYSPIPHLFHIFVFAINWNSFKRDQNRGCLVTWSMGTSNNLHTCCWLKTPHFLVYAMPTTQFSTDCFKKLTLRR